MGVKFWKKAIKVKQKVANLPTSDAAITDVTTKEWYRCRTNFGVNLGSCFVREAWMFPNMMNGKQTELHAVEEDIKNKGMDGAREYLEEFWKGFMTDDDWHWLKSHGCNGIRVPVGYWNIDNGSYTKDLAFANVAPVYSNSWNILKTHFIEAAAGYDIAVLVDLHALPGGANTDAHSGEELRSRDTVKFWKNHSFQDKMADAVGFMARDLKGYDNVSGIQVVNEAMFDEPSGGEFRYYELCLNSVRAEDKTMPIIISDGWSAQRFTEWIQKIQGTDRNLGLVVDEHCYRMVTLEDQKKTAQRITDDLQHDLLTNIKENGRGVDFMVGEYSCVLSKSTWMLSNVNPDNPNELERKKLAAQFGHRQVELGLKRSPTALYFWSYKFPHPWGEWDARVVLGNYYNAPKITLPSDGQYEQIRDKLVDAHIKHWTRVGGNYEFDRYRDGFADGWADCLKFAEKGSMIGRRQAVKFARLQEHIKAKGKLDHLWEYEHGFDESLAQFQANFFKI